MKYCYPTYSLIVILLIIQQVSQATPQLDSLLNVRSEKNLDYYRYKQHIEVRTWIKMVELSQKADSVINTDNVLINEFLVNEQRKSKLLADSLEKANLEIILQRKEAAMNEAALYREHRTNKVLLMLVGITSLLLFSALFILYRRQSNYRLLKEELEHVWRGKREKTTIPVENKEVANLSEQMTQLTVERDKLKTDLDKARGQKSEAVDALKKEIRTRRQVEKEIKDLLGQINKSK